MSIFVTILLFYTVTEHSGMVSARGCLGSICISPVWLERCKLSLSLSISKPAPDMPMYRTLRNDGTDAHAQPQSWQVPGVAQNLVPFGKCFEQGNVQYGRTFSTTVVTHRDWAS